MLDQLKSDYPAVVEEVTAALGLGSIQKVLQGLLREQVSIRNQVIVFESLADHAPVSKDPTFLIEQTRQALGRQICLQYVDDERVLRVSTIHPELEQTLVNARVDTGSGPIAALPPDQMRAWTDAAANQLRVVEQAGYVPILLTSEAARTLVKRSLERELSQAVVLSVPEIARDIKVESMGEVKIGG